MESLSQTAAQILTTWCWAGPVTFFILILMKKRPYHWPATWYKVVLVVALVLIAIIPNGWNLAFVAQEPASTFNVLSLTPNNSEPTQPDYSWLLKLDVIGTVIGFLAGWIASKFVPGDH